MMMNKPTEKQKCIAEQAIYKDLYFNDSTFPIQSISGIDIYLPMDMVADIDVIFPILRPLSDLTKEITHNGYNDDKPFVPAKVINQLESSCDWSIHMPPSSLRLRRDTKENDLLHLWHFDTRTLIEKGEAIDVNTLSINPYSVQL